MISKAKEFFKEIFLTIGPIIFIVTILQLTLVKMPWTVYLRFLLGAAMVMIGLTLLLKGLKIGLVPVGEMIGSAIAAKGSVSLLLFLGFLIGFAITIAEPHVMVLSNHLNTASSVRIDKLMLITIIGIGVGFFLMVSFLRILLKVPIIYIIIGGYLVIMVLSFFTNNNYVPIGFDAGGVITGPLTVPFIMALGMGFVYSLGGRTRTSDGFGYVGLAAIGPIISVMILGVIYN